MVRNVSCFLLSLSLLTGVASASQLKAPEFLSDARVGFAQIYNLDYDQAEATFLRLGKKYPAHPAPPLYQATAIWLRNLFARQDLSLEKFIAPSYFDRPTTERLSEDDREKFLALIDISLDRSNGILAKEPADNGARYFLGAAEGVLASFKITIDRDKLAAFRLGKKAYQRHAKIVEEDPDFYDAYMSVGVYEYIVGNLPWYIKWLASIAGYHGSEERGFEYLSVAAAKAPFVADEALLLQMVLFVREKRYDEALRNVQALARRAPKNFLFKINEAQLLGQIGRKGEAADVLKDTLRRVESGQPNFDRLPILKTRMEFGRQFLELGKPDWALEEFDKLRLSPDLSTDERAHASLESGKALDLLGRREEAVDRYEEVMDLPDRTGTRRQAKRFLNKPYSTGR